MAGVKRSRDGPKVSSSITSDSPYIHMFEGFRSELDEHHDRRERVIKTSRDVTAQSKKMWVENKYLESLRLIFKQYLRLTAPLHSSISKQTEPMQATISDHLHGVSKDLAGINAYRYQRNISGGIQEYMEAFLFEYYLKTQRVLSHQEAAQTLPPNLMLTYEDYALGLFDMTGELMRFAITYMATHGALPGAVKGGDFGNNILTDMQEMRSQLEILDVKGSFALSKEFDQKLKTTQSSVEKVENGVYSMIVRGSERPKGWIPDDHSRDQRETEYA